MQGPFDTFLVGGDTAEVCDIKFSNDGKSMLLATKSNNIYVLDAYGGEKVRFLAFLSLFFNSIVCITFGFSCFPCFLGYWYEVFTFSFSSTETLCFFLLQRCGFSLDPSPNTAIEATFTPDGQYLVSGTDIWSYSVCLRKYNTFQFFMLFPSMMLLLLYYFSSDTRFQMLSLILFWL